MGGSRCDRLIFFPSSLSMQSRGAANRRARECPSRMRPPEGKRTKRRPRASASGQSFGFSCIPPPEVAVLLPCVASSRALGSSSSTRHKSSKARYTAVLRDFENLKKIWFFENFAIHAPKQIGGMGGVAPHRYRKSCNVSIRH